MSWRLSSRNSEVGLLALFYLGSLDPIQSAISSLEVVGDKLDTMMKESEMQQEANERLEKDLQMANARVEELANANEECLRQKTKLEEDLQLRDCLFVQAEGDPQLRDGSLAQDQAEIERLTTAWKAAEDAKERLEEIECHRIGREAEMESYKTQLEEIRSALVRCDLAHCTFLSTTAVSLFVFRSNWRTGWPR